MQPITEPQADRRQRLEALHLEFFKELQETGWGFHPELRGQIERFSIELGIPVKGIDQIDVFTTANGSELVFSIEMNVFHPRQSEINIGSSGAFTPEHAAPYWRTKHASIILDNWNAFHEIAKRYCERYQNEFLNQ